ncbi:MAG TPA: S9 family peptidase [Steroidobacteraceae bacterium]|nr:S9 family peptidase [Steroidobacteraceae bacterium]
MRNLKSCFLLLLASVLLPAAAIAAGPPPLEAFFAGTRVSSVSISPDARYLAMIVNQNGRSFVAVRDRSTPSTLKPVASVREEDRFEPMWCGWANPTRLLCGFRGLASNAGKYYPITRLLAVNADGSELKVLTNSYALYAGQFQDQIIDWTPDDPNTVMLQIDEGQAASTSVAGGGGVIGGNADGYPALYTLDVYSGTRRRVARERPPIEHFTTDGHGIARLGVGYKQTDIIYFARLMGADNWRELLRMKAYEQKHGTFKPIAAIAGTNYAYAGGEYNGRSAIWKIDLTDTTDPQLVFSHPEVDIDEPLFTDDRRLIGVTFDAERPGAYFTDPQAEQAYSALRMALPGRAIRITDMTPDGKTFVVHVQSDIGAPVFYVLDRQGATARLDAVAASAPALAEHALAPMLMISYAARDGVKIPGYLTLPAPSSHAGKPPLIVMPHGGPMARDTWGFDSWVQFLASRGYAVLQMEFRGSSGYGTAWWRAGFRDWGGIAYNDVVDGTRWALAEGYADPAKTCIVGASYGGYMALIAAVRNNDHLFRCAVSIAGVSDLAELRKDERYFRNADIARAGLTADPKKLKEDSPRNFAARIDIPLLLIHGDRDYTVEVDHTKMMDAALTRASRPHETVIIEGADHYFREDQQLRTLFTRLGAFLDTQLGSKPPTTVASQP